MSDPFTEYLDRLESAATSHDLHKALEAVLVQTDLHLFAYFAAPNLLSHKPRLITNYAEPWRGYYMQHHYDTCDPILLHAWRYSDPFEWGPDFGGDCSFARMFFGEAAEFGICYGYTIPIRFWHGRFAAMTFATGRCHSAFSNRIRGHALGLKMIALQFHLQSSEKLEIRHMVGAAPLTKREYQCLYWATKGKSFADIGEMLHISPHTVRYHIDHAKAKLGVRTIREAAILLAMSRSKP